MTDTTTRPIPFLRLLGAAALLATGAIHVYLIFTGVGGILGVMFALNGAAGIVLGIGLLVLHGRLLLAAAVLGLLFLIASLAALLLALTVGLFGITEVWSFRIVPETVIVEAIGVILLAVTTGALLRTARDRR